MKPSNNLQKPLILEIVIDFKIPAGVNMPQVSSSLGKSHCKAGHRRVCEAYNLVIAKDSSTGAVVIKLAEKSQPFSAENFFRSWLLIRPRAHFVSGAAASPQSCSLLSSLLDGGLLFDGHFGRKFSFDVRPHLFILLPQEREWPSSGILGWWKTVPANPVARHSKNAANDSPSPWGEGRGEGGRQKKPNLFHLLICGCSSSCVLWNSVHS